MKTILKGIAALIKSGILFRPYTIIGLGTGIALFYITGDNKQMYEFVKTDTTYAFIAGLSCIYALISRKSRSYDKLDFTAFITNFIGCFIGAIIAFITFVAFIFSMES